ncbi:hypothetical protein STEG23_013126, partial [Scotinomys teguina]
MTRASFHEYDLTEELVSSRKANTSVHRAKNGDPIAPSSPGHGYHPPLSTLAQSFDKKERKNSALPPEALRRQRHVDLCESETSVVYRALEEGWDRSSPQRRPTSSKTKQICHSGPHRSLGTKEVEAGYSCDLKSIEEYGYVTGKELGDPGWAPDGLLCESNERVTLVTRLTVGGKALSECDRIRASPPPPRCPQSEPPPPRCPQSEPPTTTLSTERALRHTDHRASASSALSTGGRKCVLRVTKANGRKAVNRPGTEQPS